MPQISFSSCKYSWNAGVAWFEIVTRTYSSFRCGLERNGVEAHAIQVLGKPRQIFALQARNGTSVLITAKEVAEVLVELR